MGERLVVQFARGARRNDNAPHFQERTAPRPRRTAFRMSITSLPAETSWQVSNSPFPGFRLSQYSRALWSYRCASLSAVSLFSPSAMHALCGFISAWSTLPR